LHPYPTQERSKCCTWHAGRTVWLQFKPAVAAAEFTAGMKVCVQHAPLTVAWGRSRISIQAVQCPQGSGSGRRAALAVSTGQRQRQTGRGQRQTGSLSIVRVHLHARLFVQAQTRMRAKRECQEHSRGSAWRVKGKVNTKPKTNAHPARKQTNHSLMQDANTGRHWGFSLRLCCSLHMLTLRIVHRIVAHWSLRPMDVFIELELELGWSWEGQKRQYRGSAAALCGSGCKNDAGCSATCLQLPASSSAPSLWSPMLHP
jgi:hypothetical protein